MMMENKYAKGKITNKMAMIIIAIILAIAVVRAKKNNAYQETKRHITATDKKNNMSFFE